MARMLGPVDLAAADPAGSARVSRPDLGGHGAQWVRIYRIDDSTPGGTPTLLASAASATPSPDMSDQVRTRLLQDAVTGAEPARAVETSDTAGDLLHAAAPIRDERTGRRHRGRVGSSRPCGDESFTQMTQAFGELQPAAHLQSSAHRRVPAVLPDGHAHDSRGCDLDGPVSRQAHHATRAGARPCSSRIGAGISISASNRKATMSSGAHQAFNTMASELATSRLRVRHSTMLLEGRRRYVETILERITTGVVSISASGIVTTINGAAAPASSVFRARSSDSRRTPCSIVRSRADRGPRHFTEPRGLGARTRSDREP